MTARHTPPHSDAAPPPHAREAAPPALLHPRRRRRALVLLAAGVVAACSLTATRLAVGSSQRSQAGARLVVLAARERALAERYANQVELARAGEPAAPAIVGRELSATVGSLLHGGPVPAGAAMGAHAAVPAVTDKAARHTLERERWLVSDLVALGTRIADREPARISPTGGERLTAATATGRLTQLAGLTGRVALRSSRELSAASDRDVSVTIALEEGSGVLAALIAVALGAGLLLGSGGSAAAGDRGDLEGLEGDLRAALASGSLTVHYQPQVDARDGAPVGAEALVRWCSPKRGDVPPARFVALAERSDLIRQLGTFVLGAACQQAAEWLRAGLLPEGFRVWVNVSARQLTSGDLAAEVDRLLGETGLPAARLGLEVTETSVVEAGDGRSAAAATLERVRARGVLVAIDDFGTGYSSMAQLKRLPVDALKIDRAFVGDLGGSRTSEAIVENILRLGAALGLEVVAEGIETERQLAALRRLGCRFAQGYLFGRPAPADDLTGALAAARTGRLAA